jgi:adenosylcobyric acid synthase
MLGTRVEDPGGVEGIAGGLDGLGLLPVMTTLGREKRTAQVRARVVAARGLFAGAVDHRFAAYEIHVGVTRGRADAAFAIIERSGAAVVDADGAVSSGGEVTGTYLHGIFADDGLRGTVMRAVATHVGRTPDEQWGRGAAAAERYDRLADIVEGAVDMAGLATLAGLPWPRA